MKCSNHPDADAGWRCTACGKAFCETCVKMLGGRTEQVAVCPVCGEKCEEAIPREEAVISQEPSFWERLPRIVIYPLQESGLPILIAGAIFFAIADFVAGLVSIFGPYAFILTALIGLILAAYLCRYFLSVISESAAGDTSPPGWADLGPGNIIEESVGAVLQFIGPAALSYAPAVAYYFFGPKELDSTFAILVAAGSLYFPMGLLAVAYFDDLSALNPVAILRSMFRVPFRYLTTCIVFMLLLYLNYLRQKYLIIHVPILGALIPWLILLYLWTMAMHLLGMFYHTNRHKLRWA